MAKIKILLEKGETPEQAEEMLLKALTSQREGLAHTHHDTFEDPAMDHMAEMMEDFYAKQWEKMLKEIFEVIDEEDFDAGSQ